MRKSYLENMHGGFLSMSVVVITAVLLLTVMVGGALGVRQWEKIQKAEEQKEQEEAQVAAVKERELRSLQEKLAEIEHHSKTEQAAVIESLREEIDTLRTEADAREGADEIINEIVEQFPDAFEEDDGLSNIEIIAQVKPSVVYISVPGGSGSGFVIDSAGEILTNAHVVRGVSSAVVTLGSGEFLPAVVVGRDEKVDVALLRIETSGLARATLGSSDSATLKQGDEVFSFGYPFGLTGDVSFKEGTISRRLIDNGKTYLETSTEIHPGNSGGPLVNRLGEVVGINTALIGKSQNGVAVGETIKLALPIDSIKDLLASLRSGIQVLTKAKTEIVIEAAPAVVTKQYTDQEKEAYEMFYSHYVKVAGDANAGFVAYRDAREEYWEENYSNALTAAQEAVIFINSAYYDGVQLGRGYPAYYPFAQDIAEVRALLVEFLATMREAAEFRKISITSQLNGDSRAAVGADQESQKFMTEVIAISQELQKKENTFFGAANEYFE